MNTTRYAVVLLVSEMFKKIEGQYTNRKLLPDRDHYRHALNKNKGR